MPEALPGQAGFGKDLSNTWFQFMPGHQGRAVLLPWLRGDTVRAWCWEPRAVPSSTPKQTLCRQLHPPRALSN